MKAGLYRRLAKDDPAIATLSGSAAFLLIGPMCLVLAAVFAVKAHGLYERGIVIHGTVQSYRAARSAKGTPAYELCLVYRTPHGDTLTMKQLVDPEHLSRTLAHPFALLYDPDSPSGSILLLGTSQYFQPLITACFGTAMCAIGVLLLRRARRS